MLHDLVPTLLRAYKECPDKEFQAYITKMEEAYKDGEDLTTERLMIAAYQKYMILKAKGAWCQLSQKE